MAELKDQPPALRFSFPPIVPLQYMVTAGGEADQKVYDPAIAQKLSEAKGKQLDITFVSPVTLKSSDDAEGKGLKLPFDCLVSVSGSNIIIKRRVAKSKMRGTVKSLWTQDDYKITISGTVSTETYKELLSSLQPIVKRYCENRESLSVTCPVLNEVFSVTRLCIETFEFQHTDGEENQTITLNCLSDEKYNLLIEA